MSCRRTSSPRRSMRSSPIFASTRSRSACCRTPPRSRAVAAALDRHRPRHVVLDPVMVASAGQRLLREDALGALRDLIKRVDVVTPNLPEAAALLDVPAARDEAEMRAQGEKLLALGAGAVLIKGGHGSGPDSVDLLDRRRRHHAARGAAPPDAQHARHRLHVGIGARRRSRQRAAARGRGQRGQGLCHRRHRRGGPARGRIRPRPPASFSCLVVTKAMARSLSSR